MKLRSLKTGILLGAILWTLGLLLFSFLLLHFRLPHPAAAVFFQVATRYGGLIALGGITCLILGFLHVRHTLAPINQLRDRLNAMHQGAEERVEGQYPVEVQPLVDDLNSLLEERARRITRAIAKAGDLAHGLKTPLAVLSHEAQQARAAGHEHLASAIEQQLEIMRRQVDYHLAHARAGNPAVAARTPVAIAVEGLVRVLQRIHAERDLHIEVNSPSTHAFRGQREDLEEMLGNLLDNACKWARKEVRLTSTKVGEQLVIVVDDDGPGIEPRLREVVMQRGMRADEAAQGSGLGLAIVRDLAEIHGGNLAFVDSDLGGACARLTLPAQEATVNQS
ncbi:MAG: sensor histidine kinase [Blastocatellia bacterium]|nr:sensor histidine kinase [Blastocatellia bacterium]